ncbi:MAG: tetratricopeptide repeat protein [Raineya sp.]
MKFLQKFVAYILLGFSLFACGASSQELTEKARKAMQEQRFEEAILLLNKAIEKNEKNADAFNARGVALFELGKYNDAMLDYQQAIQLNPQNYKPYFNRAELYRSLKQREDALKDYEQAIKLAPDVADLYLNRGVLFYEKEKIEEAIADFKKAVQLAPNNKNAFLNLGNILFEKGSDEALREALDAYNKVIELDSKADKTYFNMAQIFLRFNTPDIACQHLQKAGDLGNEDAKKLQKEVCLDKNAETPKK